MKRTHGIFLLLVFLSCQPTTSTSNDPFVNGLIEQKIEQSGFSMALPPDYVITESRGPDFSVFYFKSTSKIDSAAFTAGLYFGNNPGEFKLPNNSCKTSIVKGTILNNDAEWTLYDCEGEFTPQTIVESNSEKEWNKKLHAFGKAKSHDDVQKILSVFATLKRD